MGVTHKKVHAISRGIYISTECNCPSEFGSGFFVVVVPYSNVSFYLFNFFFRPE